MSKIAGKELVAAIERRKAELGITEADDAELLAVKAENQRLRDAMQKAAEDIRGWGWGWDGSCCIETVADGIEQALAATAQSEPAKHCNSGYALIFDGMPLGVEDCDGRIIRNGDTVDVRNTEGQTNRHKISFDRERLCFCVGNMPYLSILESAFYQPAPEKSWIKVVDDKPAQGDNERESK